MSVSRHIKLEQVNKSVLDTSDWKPQRSSTATIKENVDCSTNQTDVDWVPESLLDNADNTDNVCHASKHVYSLTNEGEKESKERSKGLGR